MCFFCFCSNTGFESCQPNDSHLSSTVFLNNHLQRITKLSKSFQQLNQINFHLPKHLPPLQFGMTPFYSVQSWWLQSMNCDLSVTIISANLLTTNISLLGCNSSDTSESLLTHLVPHCYVISNKTVHILSNTSAASYLSSQQIWMRICSEDWY